VAALLAELTNGQLPAGALLFETVASGRISTAVLVVGMLAPPVDHAWQANVTWTPWMVLRAGTPKPKPCVTSCTLVALVPGMVYSPKLPSPATSRPAGTLVQPDVPVPGTPVAMSPSTALARSKRTRTRMLWEIFAREKER